MSYSLTLQCGCEVYVACHPGTGIAHTRVLETRGSLCSVRRHEVGLHLFLWDLLPDPTCQPSRAAPSSSRRLVTVHLPVDQHSR